jgi:sigma-54 dependent transcriptional regulator, acetoin dehydrogenase operon transcriptional activator AcoR
VTPQPGSALAEPMTGTAAWRRTLEIKHNFLQSGFLTSAQPGRLPPHPVAVRPEIVRSWRRSVLGGVDWTATNLPQDERRPWPDRLVGAARPVLARLADQLAGMHAWAFLTDGDCRLIIRVVGDRALEPRLDARGAFPGALFREDLVGTNGLGTTAEEHQPFIVAGSEHFREHESNVTTVGAPVRDPVTKRLLGLLNINCRYEFTNALLLPFVTELARGIEARLRPAWGRGEHELLEQFARASADRSRAVVAFSGEILIANTAAQSLLCATDYEVLRESACGASPGEQGTELLLSRGPAIARFVRAGGTRREPAVVVILASAAQDARVRPTAAAQAGREPLPALRRLREQLAAAHAARVPVLLRGERGTGKTTLARSLRHVTASTTSTASTASTAARFAEFDAADSSPGSPGSPARCAPRDWMNRLRAALGDPDATVVLRHLDLLDEALAGPVMRLLDDPRARIVVTAGEGNAGGERPSGALLVERLPIIIDVPPLRERAADIPALVAEIIAERLPRPPRPRCTPQAMATLVRHDWPGNLRELRQVIATALTRSLSCDIAVDDLPGSCRNSRGRRLTKLEQLERHALVTALREARWDADAAARDLGISRATIYRKLRSFGIRRPA